MLQNFAPGRGPFFSIIKRSAPDGGKSANFARLPSNSGSKTGGKPGGKSNKTGGQTQNSTRLCSNQGAKFNFKCCARYAMGRRLPERLGQALCRSLCELVHAPLSRANRIESANAKLWLLGTDRGPLDAPRIGKAWWLQVVMNAYYGDTLSQPCTWRT